MKVWDKYKSEGPKYRQSDEDFALECYHREMTRAITEMLAANLRDDSAAAKLWLAKANALEEKIHHFFDEAESYDTED